MKIKIITVGKKSQGWIAEAMSDYLKRLKPFSQVEIDSVLAEDEHKFGAKIASERESKKLLAKIKPSDFVVACDRKGRDFDSEGFAERLNELKNSGEKVCFVIGGSYGFSKGILDRADLKISFSSFTFPHELFRVMLLEQIYRAFMILANRKYHK